MQKRVAILILVAVAVGGLIFYFALTDSLSGSGVEYVNCTNAAIGVSWQKDVVPGIDGYDRSYTELVYKKGDTESTLGSFYHGELPPTSSPINAKIPVKLVRPGSELGSLSGTIVFVSPLEYSPQEFDEIAQCVISHADEIGNALIKASHKIGYENLYTGIRGVAYGDRPSN